MTLLTPLWCQPVTGDPTIEYPAAVERAALIGAIFSREGVLDPAAGQLAVGPRAAGANFTVDVAPGRAAVFGDDISDQGTYLCTSTAIENIAVPAKPASGSRYHRLVARVKDKQANSAWAGAAGQYPGYTWALELLADTGAGLPALPASAVSLAQIAVSSATTSLTAGNITDLRQKASVGTAAREGAMGALYSGFQASDSTRPLRWSVNPDGWVQLSGWVKWNDSNTTVAAGEQRTFGGTPLAAAAVKPPGVRDFVMATSFGPVHCAVFPDGTLRFRPMAQTTLVSSTWFSFDGCFYRL